MGTELNFGDTVTVKKAETLEKRRNLPFIEALQVRPDGGDGKTGDSDRP